MKILFQCDYAEGAASEVMDALMSTNLAQTPGYGMDDYCREARSLILERIGQKDSEVHFLVGGTQTNTTLISAALRPYEAVICAETGHINVHETGSIEHVGHKILTVPSYEGKLKAEDVDRMCAVYFNESEPEHAVRPKMVYISFPTELGTIYSKQELLAIRKVCDKYGMYLFIDGARLGYGLMSEGCDVTVEQIASTADAFYLGGTKQGLLFGEALVIRNKDINRDFRFSIKQNGGLLAKGRLLGVQYKAIMTDDLYFKYSSHAVRLALRIRDAFAAKGIEFMVKSPSNQQFPILTEDQVQVLERDFVFSRWSSLPSGKIGVRFCTSWATTEENVNKLIEAIRNL